MPCKRIVPRSAVRRAVMAFAALVAVSAVAAAQTAPAGGSKGASSVRSAPNATGASSAAAAGPKVNINAASPSELAYLPRVGPKVALRIVEHRKQKAFSRPEDLMEVKGIGEKLFLTLKPYVAISGPTTLTAKIRLSSLPTSPTRAVKPGGASPATRKPANAVPEGKGR